MRVLYVLITAATLFLPTIASAQRSGQASEELAKELAKCAEDLLCVYDKCLKDQACRAVIPKDYVTACEPEMQSPWCKKLVLSRLDFTALEECEAEWNSEPCSRLIEEFAPDGYEACDYLPKVVSRTHQTTYEVVHASRKGVSVRIGAQPTKNVTNRERRWIKLFPIVDFIPKGILTDDEYKIACNISKISNTNCLCTSKITGGVLPQGAVNMCVEAQCIQYCKNLSPGNADMVIQYTPCG